MMELKEDETLVLDPDDDPMWTGNFETEILSDGAALMFETTFTTGHKFDPEPTEDGGVPINTQPDPTLRVHESTDGGEITVSLGAGDGGYSIYYFALRVGHDDVAGLVRRMVRDIEDSYYGIGNIRIGKSTGDYQHLTNVVLNEMERIEE